MTLTIEEDLTLMIRETIAESEFYPNSASEAIARIKSVLVDCCENHGANRAVIWGKLSSEEKTTFQGLLAKVTTEIKIPQSTTKRIKSPDQSPSMQSQDCITEMIMGKQWKRAMRIATKSELETTLGALGKGSDRYVAISEFMEKVYPEKKNRIPVKKKIF
jgi:hypothetical protein